ncbi:unnamed protein product [Wickerhamomyces anomalus]
MEICATFYETFQSINSKLPPGTEKMADDKVFNDLLLACRLGDIESVDKLLSTGVNVVDKFDYTPLFLSSLCGHEPIVRLLLQRGAICDTDKYEGARCIYGALTDRIRNLLISYDISKAVYSNLPFASHLRSLLGGSTLLTEDIVFEIENTRLKLHRFLLSSRSEYFREKLENSWRDKEMVSLTQQSDYDAFSVVVDYIYLHHDPKKFENVDNKLLLAYGKKIKLPQFVKIIEELIEIGNDSKAKAKLMNEFQMRMFESARDNFKKLVENGIIGQKVTIDSNDKINEEQIKRFQNSNAYPDIILSVEELGETTYYPVHRSILIRDEYFKVMFSSSFSESQVYEVSEKYDIIDRSVTIPIIHLPVSSTAVAEIIIKFLYYDHADIPLEHAIDVLFAGDLLLNERLKTMAAVTLTTSEKIPEGYDLFDILRAGWETRVDRLEHYVARVIANDLDKFMKDPDFSSIVLEVSY